MTTGGQKHQGQGDVIEAETRVNWSKPMNAKDAWQPPDTRREASS
jgi:hypothetical protein